MSLTPKEIADGLRKTAEVLRKEDAKSKQKKTVKCAQILTAARGLLQMKKNLGGV